MKKLLSIFFSALVVYSGSVNSDDVEIYFNSSPSAGGSPLVIFSLDYRSNLGSNICGVSYTDGGADDDENVFDVAAVDFSSCPWNATFPEFNSHFVKKELEDGSIEFFDMLRASLRYVFTDPQLSGSNMYLGLMLNHDHVNNCENDVSSGCSNGGYIAQGLIQVPAGITALNDKLLAVPTPQGNLSHSYQGKELYFELFRYLTGQGIYNGHVGFRDYGDTCSTDNLDDDGYTPGCNNDKDYPDVAWDTEIETTNQTEYVTPFTSSLECSSVHVLNFMFGVTNQDSDSDAAIEDTKPNGGLDFTMTGGTNRQFLQLLQKLRETDLAEQNQWGEAPDLDGNQNVTSHFIYNGNVGNTINGYAVAGGGSSIEVSDDPRVLIEELRNTFVSIIRQNSTFEAPAVTVNSYNRLAHRDEVFYALFGPEQFRDWPGNLKKYKFTEIDLDLDGDGVTDDTQVVIVDSQSRVAIDPNGLFNSASCSFWSNCTVEPDGDDVDKGGAAQNLGASRNVYTYVGGNLATASPLTLSSGTSNVVHEDNTAITGAHLGLTLANVGNYDGSNDGVADGNDLAAARIAALRIARGVDETGAVNAIKEMGDPIHSRPAVIIYDGDVNDADNDGVIEPVFAVAVTTNEGYFHLINAQNGQEHFSFIPEETLPLVWKINKESPTGSGATRFDTYGLDASPVVLWKDVNDDDVIASADGDRVVVFIAQRRGGRNMYALDITERSTPKLLWQITGGVTSGYEELGETWSEPTLATVRESNGDLTDVLVFGGGYDEDRYDRDAGDPDDGQNIGRAVYVVEALTGTKRWSIGPSSSHDLDLSSMQDSVPAQVKAIDVYDDGIMDRLYFSDIAGRIFRVDFDNTGTATALHGGGLIATLTDQSNCDWTANPNSCRRFYNSLDVAVMVGFPVAPYIQLAMGSGFRAHPKNATTQDRFYVVYDQQVIDLIDTENYSTVYGANGFTEATNLTNVTDIPANTLYSAQRSTLTATLTTSGIHGWYLDMDQSLGEKVISESLTIAGQLIFTTYFPENQAQGDVCATGLGRGRVYLVDAFNGMPEATLGDSIVDVLQTTDTVKESHRYALLPREGMPTDPAVIFKEKNDGSIEPNLVVGTQMPLPPDLFKSNPVARTWWREQ